MRSACIWVEDIGQQSSPDGSNGKASAAPRRAEQHHSAPAEALDRPHGHGSPEHPRVGTVSNSVLRDEHIKAARVPWEDFTRTYHCMESQADKMSDMRGVKLKDLSKTTGR